MKDSDYLRLYLADTICAAILKIAFVIAGVWLMNADLYWTGVACLLVVAIPIIIKAFRDMKAEELTLKNAAKEISHETPVS